MSQMTMEQARARLKRESHLCWVFYRCKIRTDREDRREGGTFSINGSRAWTGEWEVRPKLEYERIAHWNDKSQILYIGRRASVPPKMVGDRWKIPMDDVEVLDIYPKSDRPVALQQVIPEAKRRIQILTYWPKSADEYRKAVKPREDAHDISPREGDLAADLVALSKKRSLLGTSVPQMILARLGQGEFRRNVLKLWGGACAVTGSTTLEAIRASHIRPWRDCGDDETKLNPHNGLPMVATLDCLFDRGLISFSDVGEMLVSKRLTGHASSLLGVPAKLRRKPNGEQRKFLKLHRKKYGYR